MHIADDGAVCVGKCYVRKDVWREVGTCLSRSIPERSNATQQTQSQVVEPLSRVLVQPGWSCDSWCRVLTHCFQRGLVAMFASGTRTNTRLWGLSK